MALQPESQDKKTVALLMGHYGHPGPLAHSWPFRLAELAYLAPIFCLCLIALERVQIQRFALVINRLPGKVLARRVDQVIEPRLVSGKNDKRVSIDPGT